MDANALPPLVEVLCSGPEEAQGHAVAALRNLACGSGGEERMQAMIAGGADEPLQRLREVDENADVLLEWLGC